jgi:hypothetical protein
MDPTSAGITRAPRYVGEPGVPLRDGVIASHRWLKQWHNEVDPEFGMRMGDYFEGFVQEEARRVGKTVEEIGKWVPPEKPRKGPAGRKKKKT